MRITFVISSMACGGAESFLIQLANCIARMNGNEVSLVNLETDPSLKALENHIAPQVQYEKVVRRVLVPRSRRLLSRFLGSHLQRFKPDVVSSHLQYSDVVAARCPQARPLVISDHGCYKHSPKTEHHDVLRQASLVICTANSNQRILHENGITHTKLIRYGLADIQPDNSAIKRQDLGLSDDQFVFCMVARGIEEKGWIEAVEAFAQLEQRQRFALIMVGRGHGVDLARSRAEALDLNQVRFVGFDHWPRRYMSISDVALLPSRFKAETYPMALLEALYEKRPFLATAIGDVPELVNGKSGLVGLTIPLDNGHKVSTKALAQAMEQMSRDYDRYRAAAERVRPSLSIERCAQQYVEAFENVAAGHCVTH